LSSTFPYTTLFRSHVVIDHIDPPADVGSQCLRQRPGVVEAYDDVVAVDEVAHPLPAQGGCRTDQRDSLPFYKLFKLSQWVALPSNRNRRIKAIACLNACCHSSLETFNRNGREVSI